MSLAFGSEKRKLVRGDRRDPNQNRIKSAKLLGLSGDEGAWGPHQPQNTKRHFPGASPTPTNIHTKSWPSWLLPKHPENSFVLYLPRWCSGYCLVFCSRRRLKDAERGRKIIKMGTGCSNRLGSTSPPNEAIIHFPIGPGRPQLIPQPATSAPLSGGSAGSLPSCGLITPSGPSQPAARSFGMS